MSEHNHQCATVNWFNIAHSLYKEHLFAIPNGSFLAGDKRKRGMQMKRLKKEGLKRGVSDLMLALPAGPYHGLFIEMKDAGKTYCSVTEDQRQFLERMNNVGYLSTWCAGCDEAILTITNYMEHVYG